MLCAGRVAFMQPALLPPPQSPGELPFDSQSVQKLLTSAASNHNGAYLVNVLLRALGNQTVVAALYRTPSPFAPWEVRASNRNCSVGPRRRIWSCRFVRCLSPLHPNPCLSSNEDRVHWQHGVRARLPANCNSVRGTVPNRTNSRE